MRRSIVFLLFGVFLGLGLHLVFEKQRVAADCQDEVCFTPPCCNGDVNGDRRVDIADVTTLLAYLFSGAEEPKPVQWFLPATGQTGCYDENSQKIECNSELFPGQDGALQLGFPVANRFVDNEDGTVTDRCTGLLWQKSPLSIAFTWQEALQYCDELELAGHKDWRLPNVRELQNLVDYGCYGPALDPAFETESSWYWSSTTYMNFRFNAWGVNFNNGDMNGLVKTKPHYLRAVRGGLAE